MQVQNLLTYFWIPTFISWEQKRYRTTSWVEDQPLNFNGQNRSQFIKKKKKPKKKKKKQQQQQQKNLLTQFKKNLLNSLFIYKVKLSDAKQSVNGARTGQYSVLNKNMKNVKNGQK